MKNYSTHFFAITVINLLMTSSSYCQDVGIGTSNPDYRLHVAGTNTSLLKLENITSLAADVKNEMFFKTGSFYTGAIKTIGTGINTARLGFYSYASLNASTLLERMSILDNGNVGIGVTNPGYLLDINGRIRIRNGAGTAGLYLMNAANSANAAFIGMYNDYTFGLYSTNGWKWAVNALDGKTGIGTATPSYPLQVTSEDYHTVAHFTNTLADISTVAVYAISEGVPSQGIGIWGKGSGTGVYGQSNIVGIGYRTGVEGYAAYGDNTNYGVYGKANYGNLAVGIYGIASGATTNWAGYFSGSVYTTGSYQSSDRKLKTDIEPITDATSIIKRLKPSAYTYKTEEFYQMHLPEGLQYGLIADEVKQVLPGAVKKAIQPAAFENDDMRNGRKLNDEVEFEAVNYTAMIPILISAMQEQQKKIEELEERLRSKTK